MQLRRIRKELEHLNSEQLEEISKAIEELQTVNAELVRFKKEAQEMLKASGFSAGQVFGHSVLPKRKGRKTSGKVAPKWKHKTEPGLTWSGRGITPKWIKKFGVKL